MKSQKSFVIVGAGIAGLAAACCLQGMGHSVRLLEARDDVGGRTRASDRLGPALDLGAAWLHDAQTHPLFSSVMTQGLSWAVTDYANAAAYCVDGRPDLTGHKAVTAYRRALHKLGRRSTPRDSVADRLANIPPAIASALSPEHQALRIVTELEEEYGAGIDELAAQALEEGSDLKGSDVLLQGSHCSLIAPLACQLDIRLNTVVTAIDYRQSSVLVSTSSGDYAADKVLVTVPLGVLKAGSVVFSPELPQCKQAAINDLGMGLLNKLYLRFPRVFWDQNLDTFSYQHSRRGCWASWFDYARLTGEPILLGFNAARSAAELESLDDAATVADAMHVLRTIYGAGIPEPSDSLVTRWGQDPFTLGSYSYLKFGSKSRQRRDLAQPVQDRLYFAGEATDRRYPATTHGAYRSGLRAARKMAAAV